MLDQRKQTNRRRKNDGKVPNRTPLEYKQSKETSTQRRRENDGKVPNRTPLKYKRSRETWTQRNQEKMQRVSTLRFPELEKALNDWLDTHERDGGQKLTKKDLSDIALQLA